MSHGTTMDRIYRYQRHFYDWTRPLFLPGRDALLEALAPGPNALVLEMGCGTARNLIRLAKRFDGVRLFGVDASSEMLRTAHRNLRRAGLADRISLARVNAEDTTPRHTFSLASKFDTIFFSYSLSMMPNWPSALVAARAALKADGRIFIVDFWDQRQWPAPVRGVLRTWLSLFHVAYPEGMTGEIQRLFPKTEFQSIGGGYAFLARPGSH